MFFYYDLFFIRIADAGLLSEMVDEMLLPWDPSMEKSPDEKGWTLLWRAREEEALCLQRLVEDREVLSKRNSAHPKEQVKSDAAGWVGLARGSQSLIQKSCFTWWSWNFKFSYIRIFFCTLIICLCIHYWANIFLFVFFLKFFPPMPPQISPSRLKF